MERFTRLKRFSNERVPVRAMIESKSVAIDMPPTWDGSKLQVGRGGGEI